MADYLVTDTQLTNIANAIRSKTGGTDPISFPSMFTYEISEIVTATDLELTRHSMDTSSIVIGNKAFQPHESLTFTNEYTLEGKPVGKYTVTLKPLNIPFSLSRNITKSINGTNITITLTLTNNSTSTVTITNASFYWQIVYYTE